MSERVVRLSAIGGAVVAVACVPKVSATLVVDESRRPEPRKPEEPERPKRPPGPDRSPPTVVRAELVGNGRLRIHFSEPVVVSEGFDPTDFRISYLRVYLSSQYSVAYYYDASYVNYGTPAALSQANFRANKLEIDFAPELAPWFCHQLEYQYYVPPNTDEGLFLHYAAGSIPIRDEAGNSMTSFGAEWVVLGRRDPPETRLQLDGPQEVAQAGRSLVRIACGPPIPPGPR